MVNWLILAGALIVAGAIAVYALREYRSMKRAFYGKQWTPTEARLELKSLRRIKDPDEETLRAIDYLEEVLISLEPKPQSQPQLDPPTTGTPEPELTAIERELHSRVRDLASLHTFKERTMREHAQLYQENEEFRNSLDNLIEQARMRLME